MKDSQHKIVRGRVGLAGLLAALTLAMGVGSASATDINLGKHIKEVKVSGDFRLRQENFNKRTKGQADRSRQRFRLRLGLEMPLNDQLKAKTRFASGTGEQVSTNQSFDNLSSQKEFWIDTAYLEYKPWSFLKLQGGRMANPMWTQYSSDIVWDGDFNPEGISESLDLLVGPAKIFANALQMVVDEDSSDNNDAWLFSQQVGTEIKLPFESRLRVGAAIHYWVNESTTGLRGEDNSGTAATFSQAATNEGNRRYGSGVLMNEFNVTELTGALSFWVMNKPVALQGTYIINNGVLDSVAPSNNNENMGYQIGTIINKASGQGNWEVGYMYKLAETDATVADIADSDFGDGGTNRRGHIAWLAYCPQDYTTVSFKAFQTKVDNVGLTPGRDDINRFQLDYSVKF